jgi:proliferating cell nuclear antigen
MKIEINQKEKSELFVNLFTNLKLITENVNIECIEDGLYIQGIDNSQICIYDLKIDKSWFNVYQCDSNSIYGMNMNILARILSVKNDNQNIILYDENDKLSIEFISENKEEINKYFELTLLDIDQEKMGIPDTEYDINIEFKSKTFKTIINELTNFGDDLKIYYNENIYLETSSIESSMKLELTEDNVEELTMTEDSETLNISFSIKYLYMFSQFHKLNDVVTIGISENIPIQIKYDLGENAYCKFYLAPKISD